MRVLALALMILVTAQGARVKAHFRPFNNLNNSIYYSYPIVRNNQFYTSLNNFSSLNYGLFFPRNIGRGSFGFRIGSNNNFRSNRRNDSFGVLNSFF